MSLIRPILLQVIPFDATVDYDLVFNLDSSSDQCFGNRIIIKDNSTNVVVYDNIATSFLLKHQIPAGTLVNGTIYNVTLAYFNISNTYSTFSDGIIFKCLSNPLIAIANITDNETINNNTYTFNGTFYQAQNDMLQTYEFYLYDSNNNLLQSSPTLFYTPSNTIQYEFGGFENDTYYGIQLSTLSQSGIKNTTGIIPFYVKYIAPWFSGNLELTNISDDGAMQITASVMQIIGQTTGDIIYKDNDWIDLTNGTIVYFNDVNGMETFDNFTLRIWLKTIIKDKWFLKLLSPQGYIELIYESWNNCINAYKNVNITNEVIGHSYIISSQQLDLTSNDEIIVFFQQNNNYLNMEVEVL